MSRRDPKNPRIVLQTDHKHIDGLLDRLIAAVRADDREAAAAGWARVEKALLNHLDVEEMFVFPALVDGHAKEVDALLREHAVLRRELGAIGLTIDLHAVRCEKVESFCATLREHAAREESLAYAEAEQRISVSVARSIFERIVRGAARRKSASGRLEAS